MIKKFNTRNSLNFSLSHLLVINKVIMYLNNKKDKDTSKTLTINHSLSYFLGSLFFIFIGIDFVDQEKQQLQQEHQYQYNIINIAWAENMTGTENADNLTGTSNKDKIQGFDISGGSGDDLIYGNEGRDVLWGKAGNDRIEGGEGNDRIYGDRGNDILIGGPGNDTLTGGLGKDLFICGTATDTINDFNLRQNDSTPEKDCEVIKDYDNTEVSQTSS